MRAIVGLWRWRNNPLCRRTDRAEAGLALCTVLLIAVCAPLAGWFGGVAVHGALHRSALQQQQERHQVWATVQRATVRSPTSTDPDSAATRDERRAVLARWAAPDGSVRSGPVRTMRALHPGQHFRVWTDGHGRLTPRPMSEQGASSHSVLAGLAAAGGAAGLLEAARRLAAHRMLLGRYARWEAEWRRLGPEWGRTGRNS